jgi:hypothetical protein
VTATDLLDATPRCLIACAGPHGPLLLPAAHWYDGEELWTTTAADSLLVGALRRAPACTVCVPSGDVVLTAPADTRVFAADQPVRLAVHAGPIAGALAVLAARHAGLLLGHTREAVLTPARWLPRARAVIRLRVRAPLVRARPEPGPGLAPPLPAVVPPDIRRALAGERRVLVAHGPGAPELTPAVWDATYGLATSLGRPVLRPGPVAVAAEAVAEPRPEEQRGLVLHGHIDGGRLVAARATWWRGFAVDGGAVPPARARGVVLPD